jgi:L-threonylcarbamoyladenylate synthase
MTEDRVPFGLRLTLRRGGVIAYPTEGVYGLGCVPTFEQSVLRILELKGRPVDKGVILIGADAAQLMPYIDARDAGERARIVEALSRRSDRARTWIVPASEAAPPWITGGRDTIAVRVTGHPFARALCLAAGSPLVSTSANRAGRRPITRASQLRREFGGAVDAICARPLGSQSGPSEIVDYRSGERLRGG